jgi:hypothetical protein
MRQSPIAPGFPVVPIVCGQQHSVFVPKRDCVIQRVEQMMIGLDSKVGCPPDDVRVIGRRKLQRSQHFDIADCRLWGKSGRWPPERADSGLASRRCGIT